MFISYFDDKRVSQKALNNNLKNLKGYRDSIAESFKNNNNEVNEYSLFHCRDFALHETLSTLKKQFKDVKYVVLIGIGGQTLGVEAVHSVLDQGQIELSVIDTISAHKIDLLLKNLLKIKKLNQIVICVSSKSGVTTETLSNASVILDELKSRFGEGIYKQTFFIGEAKTPMMAYAKKKGISQFYMPSNVGGRYSLTTLAGLIPLSLLGHDVDEFIAGYLDASQDNYESLVAESAARLAVYHQLKYPHYNFFAFEPRLEQLGRWYRQLFAESLGKETDINGKPVKFAMVPTISTPVELHSVGQLYMSGVPDTLTDFVTFDDEQIDIKIARNNKLASAVQGYTLQEVATALYGGVMAAYQERSLPYRATIFEESLPYSLGLFMAMRLREVMYTAHLLGVNAFDQPNVELYKIKTKEILSL